MDTEQFTCIVCGSGAVREFLTLSDIPIECSVFLRSAEQARNAAAADIRLAHCSACDHIFNAAFQPELVVYQEGYDNSLSHSARFRRYARELAENLVRSFRLYGKHVTEIGSGNGEFLREVCRLGESRGTGYDPSYVPTDNAGSEPVEFIRELFEERHASRSTDFVCCRHVLEHIDRPRPFMNMVRRTNADAYFEVPDVQPGRGGATVNQGRFDIADTARLTESFARQCRSLIETWRGRIEQFRAQAKSVVVWGSGSKGVAFLSALGLPGAVEYVVDINPYRQGKFMAGSGQLIVSPASLAEYKPDVVVVMNRIYRDEIRRDLDRLGLTATELLAV